MLFVKVVFTILTLVLNRTSAPPHSDDPLLNEQFSIIRLPTLSTNIVPAFFADLVFLKTVSFIKTFSIFLRPIAPAVILDVVLSKIQFKILSELLSDIPL